MSYHLFLRRVVFISTLLFSNSLFSQELHQHHYWLKLIHYKDGASKIQSKDFFLSKNGTHSPKDELIATIDTFRKNPQTICDYPARHKWLSRYYSLPKRKQCKELKNFLNFSPTQLKIVFTAERYNSPASLFGHTFLKIETNTTDYAINYGAQVDDKDNFFQYAYNGMNGNYKGRFKLLEFFQKDFEYRSSEFRDLIEFGLAFNKDEIDNILLHLYEIRNSYQNYYFITENCSSEIIKLLQLASEERVFSSKLEYAVLPLETIEILKKENLLKQTKRYPSRLSHFEKNIAELTPKEMEYVKKIINYKMPVHLFIKENIPLKTKLKIAEIVVEYIEIGFTEKSIDKKFMFPQVKLINFITKNSPKIEFQSNKFYKEKLKYSTKFKKVSLSKDLKNNISKLSFRYLYREKYDLVDRQKRNGSIELLDLSVKKEDDTTRLDYLTLFNLESLPVSNSFFSYTTNRIKGGAQRRFTDDELYWYFIYTLGKKRKIYNIDYFYESIFGFYNKDTSLGKLGARLGFDSYINTKTVLEASIERSLYGNSELHLYQTDMQVALHISLIKDTKLQIAYRNRIDHKKHDSLEAKIAIFF